MTRTLLRLAIVGAIVAGAGVAAAQNPCNDCVDGAHGACLGRHGHLRGLLHHGHHAAATAGYPNNIDNYGYDQDLHEFGGERGFRTCSGGACQYRFYGQPDLFYNYYAWPSCTGVGAQLYISPIPVPPHVGHTFITYQPLYPHEFLYTHHRTYHRYYNGGQGLNRTHVRYRASLFWQ